MSKYTLNKHYFDTIDTENKAYFLGLLYADGCNHVPSNCVSLQLQEQDKYILEKFNKDIDSNRPLFFKNTNNKNENWSNSFTLNVTNLYFSQSLVRLGCVQAKSLILKFPTEEQVPKYLQRHFIRGYFDGDGTFGQYILKGYKEYFFSICSTKMFCGELINIVKNNLNINCSSYKENKKKDTPTRLFKINGRIQIYKFLDWIYQDATIYLNRKYDKYIKNTIEPKINKFSIKWLVNINGEIKTVKEWALIYNISLRLIEYRFCYKKMKIEEAITLPI